MKPSMPIRQTDLLNRLFQPFTTPLEPVDLLRTFAPGDRPDRRPNADAGVVAFTPDPATPRPDRPPTLRWGEVVVAASRDETILEALERAGEQPAVGCRRGVCRRCVAPLVSGAVHDRRDQRDIGAGTHVRVCVSAPLTDVELGPTSAIAPVTAAAAAGGSR